MIAIGGKEGAEVLQPAGCPAEGLALPVEPRRHRERASGGRADQAVMVETLDRVGLDSFMQLA